MIRKLKLKFVALAMAALVFLLTVIIAGMNLINYNAVVTEADTILEILTQNKGQFPEIAKNKEERLPPDMSPEIPYESRYFSVLLRDTGEVINTETSKTASIDSATAVRYANAVLKKWAERGFINTYRYIRYSESGGSRIIFLDCGRKLDSFYTFLYASIFITLTGLVMVFFVIFIFSGRIIRPIAESYEKQKRFITDAGHEIKTPLTIINANVDILEMEIGENESLADIRQQAARLKSLTNDLVMLARMEESAEAMPKIEFPISEVVAEAAYPFRTLAAQQSKEFVCNIQPLLTLKGNDKAIEQLVCIFMDNALKYSPSAGPSLCSWSGKTAPSIYPPSTPPTPRSSRRISPMCLIASTAPTRPATRKPADTVSVSPSQRQSLPLTAAGSGHGRRTDILFRSPLHCLYKKRRTSRPSPNEHICCFPFASTQFFAFHAPLV